MFQKIIFAAFFFGILMFGPQAFAQQDTEFKGFSDTINTNNYIKFHLTTLLDLEPAVQFAYSYPLGGGRFQMQHELGYVTWNRIYYFWDKKETSYHGVRLRNQLRHYYLTKSEASKNQDKRDTKRNYIAVDAMYKYGNIWQEEEIRRQGGAYLEQVGLVTHKHVAALHVLVGKESEFLAGSKTMLDYYAGIGVRYKSLHSKYDHLPTSTLSPFFYDDTQGLLLFSVMAGIRIGFKS